MSIQLDEMLRETSLRIAAFEGMLAHLDLDPGEDDAPALQAELRAALMACARCPTPGRCTGWCRAGHQGTPHFCVGTQAFRNLALAELALSIRAA